MSSIRAHDKDIKGVLLLFVVAVFTLWGCSTFDNVNCFTDDVQMAPQKMVASLTNSVSKEAQHVNVKRACKYMFTRFCWTAILSRFAHFNYISIKFKISVQ